VISADTGQPLAGVRVESNTVQFTDASGRFVIANLPPGEYGVTASKGGYLTTRFGQRPDARADQVRRIAVTAGQIVDGIELAMPKGGVVTGQVIDERGATVVGMQIALFRQMWEAGQPVVSPSSVGTDQTDDRGEFRLFGIPSGTYLLGVIPMSARGPQSMAFYPGTYAVNQAQPLRVRAGQTVSGLTVVRGLASTATLSGVVTRADGKTITPDGSWGVIANLVGPRVVGRDATAAVRPDGTYEFSQLPVGEYSLRIEVFRPERLFALGKAFVDGSGTNVPLVLERGYQVRGRYVLEGDGPKDLSTNVAYAPFIPLDQSSTAGGSWAAKADGSFEASGLKGRFWASWPAPRGLTVDRVMIGNEDITDMPLDLTAGDIDDVVVVVSRHPAANLTGQVRIESRDVPLNVTVLLFPEDRTRLFPSSPFVRAAFIDASGRFTMNGVPPGRYFTLAVEDMIRGEESNPGLMELLRANGIVVNVKKGESEEVYLQPFSLPPEYLTR
jgi:hypothetical protein